MEQEGAMRIYSFVYEKITECGGCPVSEIRKSQSEDFPYLWCNLLSERVWPHDVPDNCPLREGDPVLCEQCGNEMGDYHGEAYQCGLCGDIVLKRPDSKG